MELYCDSFLHTEKLEDVRLIGYADDITLVVKGGSRDEIEEEVRWSTDREEIWMETK